ncbi:MAG: Xenobiotic-transporting ATPase [Candidatus Nomurabacteria bacterium]|nr:Xenobiotic-transporting ATPase [Candidatus Nomurabacteria bacterium]
MDNKFISKEAIIQVLKEYGWQYKKNKLNAILAFFLPAIGVIFTSFVPPLIVAKIINELAAHTYSVNQISIYILTLGGFWLLGEMLWRAGYYFMIKLEVASLADLNNKAFKKLISRDYDFYTNNFVGSLIKKGMAFPRGFENLTETLAYNVITNVFPIIFAFIILWQYSPLIPFTLLFWILLTIVIAVPIIRRRSKMVAERHEAESRMAGNFSDSMTNMLAIKSFAQEEAEQKTFNKHVNSYVTKYRDTYNYQNLNFEGVIAPIYVITNVFGLFMAFYFTIKLNLPVGTMMVVYSYYSQIARIFWEINRVYRNVESSLGAAAEFTELTLHDPIVMDKPKAGKMKVTNSDIIFEDVKFTYERNKDELFLNNFNLEIKGNQKIGLVGPSGGGKTTVTKLLLRFVDVSDGEISIDGQDIRKVTQKSLREAITYVPQEPLLFHRTLFENIAYGDPKATLEEVTEASKLAHAHEFISVLPHGYDTLVGERGIKLSGGQRQRVAIARALLKKSPIIVLDEATSSLDSESEKYIQDGLLELMKDKTALVIAHRLSTIKHLDRILVLDQGRIIQDGSHDELIKQPGLYAKLWSHQSGEVLE